MNKPKYAEAVIRDRIAAQLALVEAGLELIDTERLPAGAGRIFAGHDEGGTAWGRTASLIETCKINDVEPIAYLNATLITIAEGHPQGRLDDLLPWNCKPSS